MSGRERKKTTQDDAISGQPVKLPRKTKETQDKYAEFEKQARDRLTEAFRVKLRRMINDASTVIAGSKADKSQGSQAASVERKLEKLKQEALKRKKVPRETFPLADRIGKLPRDTTYSVLQRQKVDVGALWRAFAADNFDDMAAGATPIVIQPQEQENKGRSSEAPLRRIMKQELTDDEKTSVIELIDQVAIDVTDEISELAALMRAMMLSYASQGDQAVSARVFLTEAAIRNKDLLDENGNIPVTPLKAASDDAATEMDRERLFCVEHIQKIYSDYFGVRGVTKGRDERPFWSSLQVKWESVPKRTQDLSNTTSMATQEFARNLSTMWNNGKLVGRSLKYLLRYPVKMWLTPKREAASVQKANEKAKENMQNRSSKAEKCDARERQREKMREELKQRAKCVRKEAEAESALEKERWKK